MSDQGRDHLRFKPSLSHQDTFYVLSVDPFARKGRFFGDIFNAVLATALFRCWYWILFATAWATLIGCLIELRHANLNIQSTLLTVFGTVLGFVISYRTSSSFERYNEGRKLWSSVILASRNFARTVWFHVSDVAATPASAFTQAKAEESKARTLIEKKTVLNLIEGFAVALKHYLRGEEGTHYIDLYHLVSFLPAYDLPPGIPTPASSSHHLPLPVTTPASKLERRSTIPTKRMPPMQPTMYNDGRPFLLPARNPPSRHLFDIFPFRLCARALTKKGEEVKGRAAQRQRAMGERTQNIPLEILLYLSSYIAALQTRKVLDVPTTNLLIAQLTAMTDALSSLERILTTPIPFSYSVHLWTVSILYVGSLPFQVWAALRWVTIPATALAAFIFFGFLACGEEIENPFGFDRNDLNLDHFTANIIRVELQALTALPVPDPAQWAFDKRNDAVFDPDPYGNDTNGLRMSPEDWILKGSKAIQSTLAGDYQSFKHTLAPVKEELNEQDPAVPTSSNQLAAP